MSRRSDITCGWLAACVAGCLSWAAILWMAWAR